MTERLHFHFSLSCIEEGNGNPLQCSCLENPRDGGAWWAAVYGVAQSRTLLKRLSSSSSRYIYTGLGSDGSEHPGLVGDTEDVSYYLGLRLLGDLPAVREPLLRREHKAGTRAACGQMWAGPHGRNKLKALPFDERLIHRDIPVSLIW